MQFLFFANFFSAEKCYCVLQYQDENGEWKFNGKIFSTIKIKFKIMSQIFFSFFIHFRLCNEGTLLHFVFINVLSLQICFLLRWQNAKSYLFDRLFTTHVFEDLMMINVERYANALLPLNSWEIDKKTKRNFD